MLVCIITISQHPVTKQIISGKKCAFETCNICHDFESNDLHYQDNIITEILCQFLPARRYASTGYRDRNVSVCPSVRPSRAGIVSKRRKLAAWFLHHLVAPRL